MPVITVGSSKTYSDPQDAWDTLHASDQGGDVFVDCDAEDYPILNVTTDSFNEWTFRTVSQSYDGTATTEDLLARINRLIIGSAVSNFLTIEDISIYSSNVFLNPLTCQGNNNQFNRLIVQQTTSNVPTVLNSAAITNTNYLNCVILGGNDVVNSGFNQGATKTNCLIANGSDKGVEASGGVGVNIVDSCFVFNNGSLDLDTGQLTIINTATEDTTGNFTGFGSSECVNFAGRDYRIKLDSTLPAGVGAFFETSSGIAITVTETLNSFSDSSVLSITGVDEISVSVTEVLNSFLDGSNVTIAKDITVEVTEVLASFIDSSFVRLPTNWVDKPVVETTYTVKTPVNTIWTDKG